MSAKAGSCLSKPKLIMSCAEHLIFAASSILSGLFKSGGFLASHTLPGGIGIDNHVWYLHQAHLSDEKCQECKFY